MADLTPDHADRTPSHAGARGRYRLDSRLAAGGMGEVRRATDTVLDRAAAPSCGGRDDRRDNQSNDQGTDSGNEGNGNGHVKGNGHEHGKGHQ